MAISREELKEFEREAFEMALAFSAVVHAVMPRIESLSTTYKIAIPEMFAAYIKFRETEIVGGQSVEVHEQPDDDDEPWKKTPNNHDH